MNLSIVYINLSCYCHSQVTMPGRKQEVLEIMTRYAARPAIMDYMEELEKARFTVDDYIETFEEFKDIHPGMAREIKKLLYFLSGVDGVHEETLQKIEVFLKTQNNLYIEQKLIQNINKKLFI